jgi:hypothetical protein
MSDTTNYGLKKPAEGSSGWANDVNGNFDAIDSKMKANEGIGEMLSEHLTPGSTKHTADQIASQVGDALGTQDGLDGLLRAIIGTLDPAEFTRSLNDLRLHLTNNSYRHNAYSISVQQISGYITNGSLSYVMGVLNYLLSKSPVMYSFRYIADSTSVDILESTLKDYADFYANLTGSVSTDLSIQILKDEGEFYTQENTITTKVYKQIENYAGITKEHLDKINIGGLTVGSTYKIIVWFKRTDASGPEDPI